MSDTRTDPAREGQEWHGTTGVYVRAVGQDGKWGSFDIAELDRTSLHVWLRSRGGKNLWAENVVMILLGHEQIKPEEDQA